MFAPGAVLAGRYRLLEQIGSGGMAVVFRAMDTKLNRVVAVKVMREDFMNDAIQVENFRKEAHAVALLSHPNIVGIYDVGSEEGMEYMVKEYVDGITLKDYIRRRRRMHSEEIVKVTLLVAEALKEAHRMNIIHRDIKPQNIMVTPKGEVKVTDFGIAKFMKAGTVTEHKEAMGSVHYISPEQARGQKVDERSDLYSLGITMYEMATGEPPFDGDTPVAVAMKQINTPLPAVREKAPDLWPGLETILVGLTRKNPVDRYQSASELIADLKRVYRDEGHGGVRVKKDSQIAENVPAAVPANISNGADVPGKETPEPKERTFWEKYGAAILGVILFLLILLLVWLLFFGKQPSSSPQEESSRQESRAESSAEDEPKTASLPNFQGMTLSEAREAASRAGIHVEFLETERIYSSNYESGTIVFQSPKASEEVSTEETVTVELTISRGKQVFAQIPNYVKRPYAEVVSELTAEGVLFTISEQTTSKEEENGVILSQTPSAGTQYTERMTIVLVVGVYQSEPVRVPDLRGKTQEAAQKALKDADLGLGDVTLSASDTVPAGQVIAQSYDYGTQVRKGTLVDITVSTGKPADTATGAAGRFLLSTDLFAGSQLTKARIVVVADTDDGFETLFDQEMTAEDMKTKDIWLNYPVGTYQIRVLMNGQEKLRFAVKD